MSNRPEQLGILAWQIWDRARIDFQFLARLEEEEFDASMATFVVERIGELAAAHNKAAGMLRSVIEFPSLSLLLKGIGNKLEDLVIGAERHANGDLAAYLQQRPLPPMPDIVHDAKTLLPWLLQFDFHRLLRELRDAPPDPDAAPPSDETRSEMQMVSPMMLERYNFARPMREKDEPISFAKITDLWNKQNGDDVDPGTFEKGYKRTSDKLMSVRRCP